MTRLTKKSQMFVYAISGMGINMLNLMMNSYLCSALLIGGFGKAAIPYQTFVGRDLIIPAVWAVFSLIARILDGVIDIPMASFADNLKSRFGRRRPAILIGMIPLIISYLLFLVIPNPNGATVLNTVYYGIILCIFYCTYTLTMVTYYATFTEIVGSEDDRNYISNVKAVCDIIYFILGYVVVRMLLNSINIRIVSLIVLPLSLTMLIPIFMIKEPSNLDCTEKTDNLSLVKSLKYTFSNKPFVIWMFVYSLMTFGVQLFLGGINEYFSYVGMNMIFVMVMAFIPVPFTLKVYNRLIHKHGFGYAFRYVLITFAVGMLFMFFVGLLPSGSAKTILSIICGLICSLAIGAMFSVAYSIPSQLAAEEEEKSGVANSAMYFAVQGLFAGVASGLATGVVLTALKGSEEAQSGAITYMTLICAIAVIVSFAASFTLPKSIEKLGVKED